MGELTIYRASISEFSRHGVLLAMTQDKSVRHSYSSVQTTPHHAFYIRTICQHTAQSCSDHIQELIRISVAALHRIV